MKKTVKARIDNLLAIALFNAEEVARRADTLIAGVTLARGLLRSARRASAPKKSKRVTP